MKKFTIIVAILFSLTISAQNTITTHSVTQTSTCAGGSVTVRYSTTGTFPAGTVFIAQLSDSSGNFSDSVNIGQTNTNFGSITATLPDTAGIGSAYRVRVITTSPAVIGTASVNTVTVTTFPKPDTITKSCYPDSAILTANASASYRWSTGSTTQSIIVKTLGAYSVTTTDSHGCKSSVIDTIGISCISNPLDSIITDSVIQTFTCAGTNVTVRFHTTINFPFGTEFIAQFSDSALNFSGSPLTIGQTNFIFNNKGTITATLPNASIGYYLIRVISNSPASIGTVALNPIKINYLPQPDTITPTCLTDSAILTANASASYRWSTGSTTQSITVLTLGTYSVTTIDSHGCKSSAIDTVGSICITNPEILITTDSITQTSMCAGTNVTVKFNTTINFPFGTEFIAQLSDSVGNFSDSVNIGQTFFANNKKGSITATLPDTLGVGSGYLIRVITNTPASIGSNSLNTITIISAPQHPDTITPACETDSAILVANTRYSYRWSTGSTSQSITVYTQGTYSLTTTNSFGCSSTTSYIVDSMCVIHPEDSIMTTSVTQTNTCAGSSVTVRFNTTARFPNGTTFIAQLSNASGSFSAPVNIGQTNFNFGFIMATLPANAGIGSDYRVRVITTSPTSVIGTTSVNTLTVTTIPQQATITLTCKTDSAVLTASSGSSYRWSNFSTTQAVTVTEGTYSVTTTDSLGCRSVASYSVGPTTCSNNGNAIITDSVTQTSDCAGGTVIVRYKTIGSFPFGTQFSAQLSSSTGSFSSPVDLTGRGFAGILLVTLPSNLSIGFFYRIRVISTNPDVIGSNSLNTITILSIPQLNKITVKCKGDSATLTANASSSYKWSTGQTTQSITVVTAGIYSVTTTSLLGCKSVISDTIPKPTTITVTCKADSAILTAMASTSYKWSTGDTTQSIKVNKGIYSIITTDSVGCQSTASDTISASTCGTTTTTTNSTVINPNVFTPNDDGMNDLFIIPGLNINDNVIIYSRWGAEIGQFNGIIGWDGKTGAGEKCLEGVYYYIVRFNENPRSNIQPKGFIQLIR